MGVLDNFFPSGTYTGIGTTCVESETCYEKYHKKASRTERSSKQVFFRSFIASFWQRPQAQFLLQNRHALNQSCLSSADIKSVLNQQTNSEPKLNNSKIFWQWTQKMFKKIKLLSNNQILFSKALSSLNKQLKNSKNLTSKLLLYCRIPQQQNNYVFPTSMLFSYYVVVQFYPV